MIPMRAIRNNASIINMNKMPKLPQPLWSQRSPEQQPAQPHSVVGGKQLQQSQPPPAGPGTGVGTKKQQMNPGQ